MRLKGEITGVFRDTKTGEITKTVTGTNHIQDIYLSSHLGSSRVYLTHYLNQNIFISDINPGRQRRDWSSTVIGDCYGGSDISGVTSPILTLDKQPGIHLIEYAKEYTAPVEDFTINIVGLGSAPIGGSPGNATGVDTVVWLDTPCTFLTTETLNVFYRIQVLFNEDWKDAAPGTLAINGYEAEVLAEFLAAIGGSKPYIIYNDETTIYNVALPHVNTRKLSLSNFLSNTQSYGSQVVTTFVDEINNEWYRKGRRYSIPDTNASGHLLGSLGTQESQLMFNALPEGESPLQSIFGHRDASVRPFYFASTSQLGTSTINVNADLWPVQNYAKFVRIDITTTGAIGIGAYKIHHRTHFGFEGNTYENISSLLPWTSYRNGHYSKDDTTVPPTDFAICRDDPVTAIDEAGATATTYPLKYTAEEVIFLWNDSFSVTNVRTGEGVSFHNTTLVGADVSPFFLATSIIQVAVADNFDFYVACEDTCLYKFNAALDTLTVINSGTTGLTNTLGCQGVCIGNAGRVWAYFIHTTAPTLYYSDDDGSTWTDSTLFAQTDATLNDNPERIMGIQADVSHVTGQLAILYREDETTTPKLYIKWWDQATTAVSDGPLIRELKNYAYDQYEITYQPGHHYRSQNSVKCSPNQGVWASHVRRAGGPPEAIRMYPVFLTFGSNTVTEAMASGNDLEGGGSSVNFGIDAAGNDAIFYITYRGYSGNEAALNSHVVLVSTDLTYEHGRCISEESVLFSPKTFTLHLGGGIWFGFWTSNNIGDILTYMNMGTLFTSFLTDESWSANPGLEAMLYPEYGWDGANWVAGHAGQRTIHGTTEEVYDGVTLSFDDTNGDFEDSDHYTFGLYDGIWMDNQTSFDYTGEIYAKPTEHNTETQFATLPAATNVPNHLVKFETATDSDYVDIVNTTTDSQLGEIEGTVTGTTGVYDSGLRSKDPSILGTITNILPNNTRLYDSEYNNVQGYIEYTLSAFTAAMEVEHYMGLSPIAVIGTGFNPSTIAYAMHYDSTASAVPGAGKLRVVESGVERAAVEDLVYDTNPPSFRITLLQNGAMLYEYYKGSIWFLLYESAPATVPMVDYYRDLCWVPRIFRGYLSVSDHMLSASVDYYMYLGDGISKGIFAPDFYAIDPERITITIDGTEAVNFATSDAVSVLAANTYSIFPYSGVIRFSASDVGKSVTADYVTITHT